MSNSNVVPIAHSAMREDLPSPIQGLPFITRAVVYLPLEIYQLLAAVLGGPPNIMNALLPSSVEVQINSGATGVHYRGRINDIQPIQDHFPDAILNGHSSPRDAITTSRLHENVYPHQGPSGTRWEHATTILGTGSSGFESAPRDLKSHAALQVHYPSLPPELPSTIQPIFLPSASSSSNTTPSSNQPHLLGGGATAPEIPPADSRISHHMEHATQSAQGHQIQHSGSYGFELALGGLKHHAVLQNHHSSSPPELPSTMQPIIISSVSSSTTATPPASAQPPFLGGSTTLPKILSADGQVFHHSEDGIQPAHGHQIQQPGCPRAYIVDDCLVDEEYLIDGNTEGGYINVYACGREHSPCGLWVKADRRSIMRHGQRWHQDARGGGDKKITCPWSGCDIQMRASAIPRHTLTAHFGAKWTCRATGCSKVFTRHDSFRAHSRKCGCLGATVSYGTSARVINTQTGFRHYG